MDSINTFFTSLFGTPCEYNDWKNLALDRDSWRSVQGDYVNFCLRRFFCALEELGVAVKMALSRAPLVRAFMVAMTALDVLPYLTIRHFGTSAFQ